jgi:hypothetical protein
MRYRKVRIAWSVACVVACVLLIALWVRSNWWLDEIWITLPSNRALGFISAANCGSIGIQQRGSDKSVYTGGYSRAELQKEQKSSRIFRGFSIARNTDPASFINMPYWFLVLVFAALPWLRWRFSLRTLLIATTLIAAGLGLAVYVTRNQ